MITGRRPTNLCRTRERLAQTNAKLEQASLIAKLTATAELVVPKSMPTTRSEGWVLSAVCAAQFRVILLLSVGKGSRQERISLQGGEAARVPVIILFPHKLLCGRMPLIVLWTEQSALLPSESFVQTLVHSANSLFVLASHVCYTYQLGNFPFAWFCGTNLQ